MSATVDIRCTLFGRLGKSVFKESSVKRVGREGQIVSGINVTTRSMEKPGGNSRGYSIVWDDLNAGMLGVGFFVQWAASLASNSRDVGNIWRDVSFLLIGDVSCRCGWHGMRYSIPRL